MVETIKFSEMTNAGNINNNDIMPSLRSVKNVILNNPWTFLPPGSTAQRPTPSSTINYRLRFNTDDQLYEYYDAILMMWTQLQESAFTQGPFLTYTASASLPDAQNLGALSNGILKQTITTGISTLDIAVVDVDYYGPGMTGFLQAPAGVKDSSGNIILTFTSNVSPVNYFDIANAPTGSNVNLTANGSDTDIGISIVAKNAGSNFISSTGNIPLKFSSGTAYQHTTNFIFSNTLAERNVTFQDADGTVAYLTDIPSVVPAALTKTDDTNITLSLGGTPATALLQAVSLTLGWTGTLAETRGGTAQSTYALGDTLYASAANTLSKLSGNITAVKQYLSQTGTGAVSAAPIWATINGGDITGAALTRVDDTNVTLTLGGTPTTALLRATSMTLGWTGTLSGTRGGTGINNGANTATFAGNLNFAAAFSTSGNFAVTQTYTGITNVTFPTTGTLATTSQIPSFPLSPANGGTGVANTGNMTWGAAVTFSGAFASTFTLTGITGVTFPTTGTLSTLAGIETLTNKTLTSPKINQILDTNGNISLLLDAVASAVNYVNIVNSVAGSAVGVKALGSDTDIGIVLQAKNAGIVVLESANTTTGVRIISGTSNLHVTNFLFSNTTNTRNVTFQDSDGTVAYTSQIPSVTPAALTKTDDTNVTLTLGGTPTTALLQATSLTLGWTGQLSVARGGTGISSFGTGVATALGQNVNGSGAITLTTSPIFITPVLGAASATSLAFTSTSGIIGTTTNDSAAAGSVGEYISSTVLAGSAVSATSGNPVNITSISLTAGDWDVDGVVDFLPAAGTVPTQLITWVSTTSATLPTRPNDGALSQLASSGLAASTTQALVTGRLRLSLSGTTTVYLSATTVFSVSTMGVYGFIGARRRR